MSSDASRSRGSVSEHATLVAHLINTRRLSHPRAIRALSLTDRGIYTDRNENSYEDRPLTIGLSQTISAPHMHAMCLDLLAPCIPRRGGRVLDIGCGSGYLTAALMRLVLDHGEDGIVTTPDGVEGAEIVVGIDRLLPLVEMARRHLAEDFPSGLPESFVKLIQTDGWLGYPVAAPFHAIHVGAAAESVPQPLLDQLAPNGRLIIPVGTAAQGLLVIDRDPSDQKKFHQRTVCGVRYVPLVKGLPSLLK